MVEILKSLDACSSEQQKLKPIQSKMSGEDGKLRLANDLHILNLVVYVNSNYYTWIHIHKHI